MDGDSPEANVPASGPRLAWWLVALTAAIVLAAVVTAAWLHLATGTSAPRHSDAPDEPRHRQADLKGRDATGPPLLAATSQGDAKVALVEHSDDADPADLAPVLGAFIATSRPDVIQAWLQRYPDLSRPSKRPGMEGQSLLHMAVLRKDIRLAEMLVAAGAEVNIRDGQERTVLDVAVESAPDQPELIGTLLARRAEGDIGHLYKALELLLAVGRREAASNALLRMQNIDSQRDDKGHGLIHMAAMAGNKAMIDLLLAHDVSLKIATWEGATPLHAAVTARKEAKEITAVLLAHKADPNTRDLFERTPLYLAAQAGAEPAVLQFLLDAGAKVDTLGDRHLTPLLLAASRGDKANVRLLLAYKAAPDGQDEQGQTPLHYAALKGDRELAEIMLAAGSSTRIRDNSHMLARVYAANAGHPDISDLILRMEAERGETPTTRRDRDKGFRIR